MRPIGALITVLFGICSIATDRPRKIGGQSVDGLVPLPGVREPATAKGKR